MNKKIILLTMILGIVLVSGCVQTQQQIPSCTENQVLDIGIKRCIDCDATFFEIPLSSKACTVISFENVGDYGSILTVLCRNEFKTINHLSSTSKMITDSNFVQLISIGDDC